MKRSRISIVAWALFAIVLALVILNAYLKYQPPHAVVSAFDVASDLSAVIFLLLCSVVAALIISRQPRNPIGWLLMLISLSNSMAILLGYFLQELVSSPSVPTPILYLLFWFDGWSWWLAIGPLLLVLLLFPNGKPPSPRWRWVIYLLGFCFVLFVFIVTFSTNMVSLSDSVSMPNPIGWLSAEAINWLVIPMQMVLGTCAVSCGAAVLVRFRRAQMVEKAQIKWLLYACAIFLVVYTIGFFVQQGSSWEIFFNLTIIGIPAAIGVAILRYHLFDIDLIIRRTLVYSLVTGTLALIYFGSVSLLQILFVRVSGQQSPISIVISTLVIAALFNPMRRQVQDRIDRSFNRQKYDGREILERFAAHARDEVELDQLSSHLLAAVQETMQPVSVRLWLSGQKKGKPN